MPAVQPKVWQFRQLSGNRNFLTLAAWSAPYGRPRQKAVVTDAISLRQTEIYYNGNDVPTRHIFGIKREPWELTGRFRDGEPAPHGGTGYAKSKTLEVKRFVLEQQPVSITWGDIISATGLIQIFEPKREAEYDVEWRMVILIDQDDDNGPAPRVDLVQTSPPDQIDLVVAAMNQYTDRITSQKALKPGLLESIENAVASVNSAVAVVTDAVHKVDSFEKSLVGDIKRLRAGLGQLKTASLNLQSTISNAQNDLVLVRRSSDFDNGWMSARAVNEVSLSQVLAMMWRLDRQAEIAERGKTQSSYVAQLGDSWESISIKFLGGPDKAQKIRDANGIKYGAMPAPGTTYKIPFQ